MSPFPGSTGSPDANGFPGFTGIAHIAVVVRDLETSVDWYERALGFERVGDVRPGPVEAGHPRQLMRHAAGGLTLAVHEPLRRSGDLFDPSRTGLDHFSLTVADRAALEAWIRHLDGLGFPHSPVRDTGYAEFLTVTDPDGIPWELWAAGPQQ
ncbi:VOC family protein [Actinacidiphila acidipaludis]|uniref:VOC family protein n=1 Tax=Actinacidiphila acidipaludis TaxID=2873382 RepID=A0ABS7Q9G9_9ACTN|nr:VOC family protein [Streptomyces acidipaludis]MBY8879090.1 VOC family protein [Streptomyces acidipaludis]